MLRDIHDAIRLIRQMTATQSFQPIEEELLKKQLLSITHELSTLEKVTAGKDPAKLTVRLNWVLKSPEIDRALQELERRKGSLTLLLQTITMYVESTLQYDAADILSGKTRHRRVDIKI